jgi:hypothetical protein
MWKVKQYVTIRIDNLSFILFWITARSPQQFGIYKKDLSYSVLAQLWIEGELNRRGQGLE